MAIRQLLPLAIVLIMACISSNASPEPNLGTPVESQEGFPGHVALRPDYAVWNIVKMLRNFMDSNADRPVRRDISFGPRHVRSERPKFYFSI
ncbi:hypothetical protein V3C99_013364 [Haemonchus contortus]|uniref:Gastrin domain-containing protein n=1 Tax=Haemonchus contortus TaxID=6289 RepID=A0A7I4Y323_HAECO